MRELRSRGMHCLLLESFGAAGLCHVVPGTHRKKEISLLHQLGHIYPTSKAVGGTSFKAD